MLFADLDANGLAIVIAAIVNGMLVIIAALVLGLQKLYSMRLESEREKAKILRDEAAAARVEEVRLTAAMSAREVKERVAEVAQAANIAARETVEVKKALVASDAKIEKAEVIADAKRTEMLKVVNVVHTLVNNRLGVALASVAALARRVAEGPGATAEDHAAAVKAEQEVADHNARQALADAAEESPR